MNDGKSREGTGELGMGQGDERTDVSVATAECADTPPAPQQKQEGGESGTGDLSGSEAEADDPAEPAATPQEPTGRPDPEPYVRESQREEVEEAYLRGRNDALRELMDRPGLYQPPVDRSPRGNNEADDLASDFLKCIRPSAWD